jgi:activator-of-BECN1-regulated-autophagy protein 1
MTEVSSINNCNNSINKSLDETRDERFRRVLPAAKEARGRSIVNILYDRSIRGVNGIGGSRRHYEKDNRLSSLSMSLTSPSSLRRLGSNLSNASPSSVIRSGSDSDEELVAVVEEGSSGNGNGSGSGSGNVNTNLRNSNNSNSNNINNISSNRDVTENNDTDSLSDILKDSNSDEETKHDSLSDVLNQSNNTANAVVSTTNALPASANSISNTNASTISTTTDTFPSTNVKIPPRLKMNAYPARHWTEIKNFVELHTVTKFNWSYLSLRTREEMNQDRYSRSNRNNGNMNTNGNANDANTDTAISTISIDFSPDGRTVASTHGDHSVKITCCNTGALIRNLVGHPRTPWTVKYHPTKPNLVASGCLGFQVRVWDWNYGSTDNSNGSSNNSNTNTDNSVGDEFNYLSGRGQCLSMIRLQSSIISLSFHPTGSLLAVASGRSLHLWVYDDNARNNDPQQGDGNSGVENNEESQQNNVGNNLLSNRENVRGNSNGNGSGSNNVAGTASGASTIITQIRYEHNLRCVHFPPGGDTIILGGVNPSQAEGDTSYSLRLWDFDLEVALNPQKYLGQEGQMVPTEENGNTRSLRRDALKNFRTFVPRALLYNDGGFDVSPDGKMLCGCAEYWLPDGIDSAMELIEKKDENAWNEEETRNTTATGAQGEQNSTSRPVARSSPRRKISRPHRSNEEKRRKETSGTRASEANREQNVTNSPSERLTPRPGGCRTPPNPIRPQVLTSPPSPPGRRWSLPRMPIPLGGMEHQRSSQNVIPQHNNSNGPPPPPLPPSHHPSHRSALRVHPSIGSNSGGRYVPHVVVVNLDKTGKLGQLLEATPLGSRASSVTCVKFSPSAEFCLLGYGVREHATQPHGQQYHPVTALYRIRGGISHIATMLSSDDDVNIAKFHPHSGHGFAYGTKQGRVRVLSPRPWNEYYE